MFAQTGGKAEPTRLEFAKGKSNAVLIGTFSNGQQMECVFGAKAGKEITFRVCSEFVPDRREFFQF